MFTLKGEIEKREQLIAENEQNKEVVAELEKALAEAKEKVLTDDRIRVLGVEIEQIKEIAYKVGELVRPSVEEA